MDLDTTVVPRYAGNNLSPRKHNPHPAGVFSGYLREKTPQISFEAICNIGEYPCCSSLLTQEGRELEGFVAFPFLIVENGLSEGSDSYVDPHVVLVDVRLKSIPPTYGLLNLTDLPLMGKL